MLEKLPGAIGHALKGVRPGLEKTAFETFAEVPAALVLQSPAFEEEAALPVTHTADGAGASPPLAWTGAPAGTHSLALLVEDADSPTPSPLVHLVAWGLPPEGALKQSELAADTNGPALGKNSFGRTGWLAPDPPPGHGPHRYVFQAYALDTWLGLDANTDRGRLLEAMRGHVLARGRLIGTYERG